MPMTNCTEVRPGDAFVYENQIYVCVSNDLNKTAMAKMKVKIRSRNLKTGNVLDLSFIGGDKVDVMHLDKKMMQYLYDDGVGYVFMDTETYDQISIPKERLEWEKNFLVADSNVAVTMFNGDIIGIQLPAKVELTVTECEPAVRGDTINKALKDAKVETGLELKVPMFVENGEKIIVSTLDGSYVSRA